MNMAEPALREQLSNYIARRVTTQAEAVVEIYAECRAHDWQNSQSLRQLLETSEKLTKLAKKLPHRPFADSAQKISSLLKLGNFDEKPSHKARNGIIEAMRQIHDQLNADALLRQKQSQFHLTNICLAISDHKDIAPLPKAFGKIKTSIYKEDTTRFKSGTCFVIEIDYPDSKHGLELATKLLDSHPGTSVIFYSAREPDIHVRLQTIRHKGEALVVGALNQRNLTNAINQAFDLNILPPPLVAVVDDSLSQLKYAENILRAARFESLTINAPATLLSRLESEEPDVLLLDMYLQDCTGIEIAKLLKQHPRWKNLPIVFMSAEEDRGVVEEAQNLTQAPFLTKPAKAATLISTINKILKRNKLTSV